MTPDREKRKAWFVSDAFSWCSLAFELINLCSHHKMQEPRQKKKYEFSLIKRYGLLIVVTNLAKM